MDTMNITDAATADAIVEAYCELRARVYNAATRNSGELMGKDAWLSVAMDEREIQMSVSTNGEVIHCHGMTFTTQTQDHEWFDFTVPFSALEA